MPDSKIEEVKIVLGTPFSGDLPENAIRVRRNFMAVSLVSIILVLTGAKVDLDSTLLGVRFTGLKFDYIPLGLLALNIYFLIHYFWYVVEAWVEWRLRLTGTRLAFQTGAFFGSDHADYHDDPRQSTLYNWWIDKIKGMSSLKDCIKQIENNILKNEGESANLHGESSSSNAIKTAAELEVAKKSILSLKDQIGSIERTINSPRMLVSLERFDKWFYFSLRMQSMRWILIDLSFPMLLGIAATWLLVHQIFCM